MLRFSSLSYWQRFYYCSLFEVGVVQIRRRLASPISLAECKVSILAGSGCAGSGEIRVDGFNFDGFVGVVSCNCSQQGVGGPCAPLFPLLSGSQDGRETGQCRRFELRSAAVSFDIGPSYRS